MYLLKLDYDKEKRDYLKKCRNKIIASKIKERNLEYLHPPDLFGRILVNPYPIIDLVNSYSEKTIILALKRRIKNVIFLLRSL